MDCDSLHWGNADQFMSAPNYTVITLNLSGTFDASQMRACIWYDNVKTIWSVWDTFNSSSSSYAASHIATGIPIHLIVMSVKDGKLYTSVTPTTATANGVYNITLSEMSENDFTSALN